MRSIPYINEETSDVITRCYYYDKPSYFKEVALLC